MKFQLSKSSSKITSETLVEFVSVNKDKINTDGLPKSIKDLATVSFRDKLLKGNVKDVKIFPALNLEGYKNVVLVGLGDKKKQNIECIRFAASSLYSALKSYNLSKVDVSLTSLQKHSNNLGDSVKAFIEGAELTHYNFDDYKPKDKDKFEAEFNLVGPAKLTTKGVKDSLNEGIIMSECIMIARKLGDTPGNYMTPEILAKTTVNEAKGSKLKVTVWDKARIKKEKMGGLLGVSLGGGPDPRFIIMEYKGAAASKKPVCFVGKGLTFDSGGISIKPSAGMHEMKYDMCGGANVIGTMLAIARLKLKVNVVAYVPSTENMPGPMANKPGDILTARNGKQVEVLNTDAEGRLILMDALSYACEQKPAVIFDAATLTGAVIMALGNSFTGVFTREDKLFKKIKKAADSTCERVWQLPLMKHHMNDMKGTHAELSNMSSFRGAGSSTAAAFLSNFVDEDIPWAHFDIAGTAWKVGNRLNYCPSKGASGAMIRTFVELSKMF